MKTDIPSNAPSSGTMSASEQAPKSASEQAPMSATDPRSDSEPRLMQGEQASDAALSESEYLARESALTKAALARTFEDLKKSLRTSADLRAWTRRHPWAALGAAAVAGFSAATVVTANRAKKTASTADSNGDNDDQGHDNSSTPLAASIFSALFDLAKVALETSIAATAPPQPAEMQAQEYTSSQSGVES